MAPIIIIINEHKGQVITGLMQRIRTQVDDTTCVTPLFQDDSGAEQGELEEQLTHFVCKTNH